MGNPAQMVRLLIVFLLNFGKSTCSIARHLDNSGLMKVNIRSRFRVGTKPDAHWPLQSSPWTRSFPTPIHPFLPSNQAGDTVVLQIKQFYNYHSNSFLLFVGIVDKHTILLWYVSRTSTNNYLRISEKYFDPVKAYCIRSTDVLVTI